MRLRPSGVLCVSFLCLAVVSSGQAPASRFRLLETTRQSTLAKEVADAAAQGYRVVVGDASVKLLVLEQSDTTLEYFLSLDIESDLKKGKIPAGFHVIPQTVASWYGVFGAAFERAPGDDRPRHYRVEHAAHTGNIQKDILAAAAEGWRPVTLAASDVGHFCLLERETADDRPEAASTANQETKKEKKVELGRSDFSRPYLLLATSKTGTMEKEFGEAVSKGFRLVAGTGYKEILYLLERLPENAPRPDYRILGATRSGTLEKELNAAAREGYRLHPMSLVAVAKQASLLGTYGYETIAVAEKVAAPAPVEYRVIGVRRVSTLEKELQQAGVDGFAITALVVGQDEILAVLQRKALT